MNYIVRTLFFLLCGMTLISTAQAQQCTTHEQVTGGTLDLPWTAAFGGNNMKALTLGATDAGFNNPSGDHTVACLTNLDPAFGGIAKAGTDPGGFTDYTWEGQIFTGDGNTRRGLVVRANPDSGLTQCYQFVIEAGLLEIRFRRLAGQFPVTLGSWFTTSTPGGMPGLNEWHHMKISAIGDQFRVWWDGFEFTAGTPITDAALPSGWVGAYNFRFNLGGVQFLMDDLCLIPMNVVAVENQPWSAIKTLYR